MGDSRHDPQDATNCVGIAVQGAVRATGRAASDWKLTDACLHGRTKWCKKRDLKPIRIRQSAYLYNRIEQDHRAIKTRVREILVF